MQLDERRPKRVAPSPQATSTDTGGGGPPSPPKDPERKFEAKRLNEQIKAFYSIANTLAAATIVAAYLVPQINNHHGANEPDRPGWIVIGLFIHLVGQAAIRYGMRKED